MQVHSSHYPQTRSLERMLSFGIPIATGFIVAPTAWQKVAQEQGLERDIAQIMKTTDLSNTRTLEETVKTIERKIRKTTIPDTVLDPILDAYLSLHQPRVMISEVFSKTPQSWVEPQTLYGLQGDANIFECIKLLWAQMYSKSRLYYQATHRVQLETPSLFIQRFPKAKLSGVCLTQDPALGKNRSQIKMVWGEGGVQQQLTGADYYWVERSTGTVVRELTDMQKNEILYDHGSVQKKVTPASRQKKRKASPELLKTIASIAATLHQDSFYPVQFRFASDGTAVWVTLVEDVPLLEPQQVSAPNVHEALVTGVAISPGIVTGPVKIIQDAHQAPLIKTGDVVIAPSFSALTPEILKKTKAVIIEQSGVTGPHVPLLRTRGIACLVGATGATQLVRPGTYVTVSTPQGTVFSGSASTQPTVSVQPHRTLTVGMEVQLALHTQATKHVVTGPVICRPDALIATLGVHPLLLVREKKDHVLSKQIVSGVLATAARIETSQVWYSFSDLYPSHYATLRGGNLVETAQGMDAYHGAIRMMTQQQLYAPEISAILSLRRHHPHILSGILIPSVRSVIEYKTVKDLLTSQGLKRQTGCQYGIIVSIPALIWQLEGCIQEGVDLIVLDLDALATHLFGADPGSSEFAATLSGQEQALQELVKHAAATCAAQGVPCHIRGTSMLTDTIIALAQTAGIDACIAYESVYAHIHEYIDTVYS